MEDYVLDGQKLLKIANYPGLKNTNLIKQKGSFLSSFLLTWHWSLLQDCQVFSYLSLELSKLLNRSYSIFCVLFLLYLNKGSLYRTE
jgi:hypothetical protein